jgi:hypothetical protein
MQVSYYVQAAILWIEEFGLIDVFIGSWWRLEALRDVCCSCGHCKPHTKNRHSYYTTPYRH